MYIPNQPSKYGLKILMMCDSGTKNMINAVSSLGKGTQTNGQSLEENYVIELIKLVHGTT